MWKTVSLYLQYFVLIYLCSWSLVLLCIIYLCTYVAEHFCTYAAEMEKKKPTSVRVMIVYIFLHSFVKSVTNPTLFCHKSELCCDFLLSRWYLWLFNLVILFWLNPCSCKKNCLFPCLQLCILMYFCACMNWYLIFF